MSATATIRQESPPRFVEHKRFKIDLVECHGMEARSLNVAIIEHIFPNQLVARRVPEFCPKSKKEINSQREQEAGNL